MIIPIPINLKTLFRQGKAYLWHRPAYCLNCLHSPVWGHGFVVAYFDPFNSVLYLKRYRCPNCRAILQYRPKGYFSRFRVSIASIRASIVLKSAKNCWLLMYSRSRQNHWYRALLRRMAAYFGREASDPVTGFDAFVLRGIVPVSRAI